MNTLLLVSQSPRRQDLLIQAGIPFTVVNTLTLSEIPDQDLDIDSRIIDLSLQKARQAIDGLGRIPDNSIILTADTVVVFEDHFLGKPHSEKNAVNTLTLLSGQTHQVKTGYCMVDVSSGHWITGLATTSVTFRNLEEHVIKHYVSSGEPMDKAGAYAIQGAASDFVESIEGSHSNVVGLPIEEIRRQIASNGWHF